MLRRQNIEEEKKQGESSAFTVASALARAGNEDDNDEGYRF